MEDDNIDYSKIKSVPLIPIPNPFDVEKRIQELRSYLDPKSPDYQPENQHINIKAVIKLYEEGKIDGSGEVFIKDGKIVSEEETFEGPSPSFMEGISYDLAEKYAYGHGSAGIKHHEVSFPKKKEESLFLSLFLHSFFAFLFARRSTNKGRTDSGICVRQDQRSSSKAFPGQVVTVW